MIKTLLISSLILASTAVSQETSQETSQVVNLWPKGDSHSITSTLIVDDDKGSCFQSVGQTIHIDRGGTLKILAPQWDTIIQQQVEGSSTININSGGTLDGSATSNGGVNFFVGNQDAGAIGILNLNGGVLRGSGFTNFVLGRKGATGHLNIIAGTATLGSLVIGTGTGVIDFSADSTGALTVTGADQTFYKKLFAAGNLTHAGSGRGTFTDHFQVLGSTITLATESPSGALLGLGNLTLILRSRR